MAKVRRTGGAPNASRAHATVLAGHLLAEFVSRLLGTVQRGGVCLRVVMDKRYRDAIIAAGLEKKAIPKKFFPAITWNRLMLEKVDVSKVDFSKF